MIFIRNYSFDFLHGGKNSNFTLSEKDSNQNSVICFSASKSGRSQEWKFFWSTFVDIQSNISLQLQGIIYFSKLSVENRTSLVEGLIEKTNDIAPCIKILIVQVFQKVGNKNISSRLSK